MSASDPHPVAYPYAWLQPVRYDLDQYRQFAEALDGDLADLVAVHAPVVRLLGTRKMPSGLQRDDLVDTEPHSPPEQSSH